MSRRLAAPCSSNPRLRHVNFLRISIAESGHPKIRIELEGALIWRNANKAYCCSREATKALTANFGEFTLSVSAMVTYCRVSSSRCVKA
jgi:hypothetical protein